MLYLNGFEFLRYFNWFGTQCTHVYTLSKRPGLALYNSDEHQLILTIFGRNVAKGVCYRKVICFATSPY